MNIPKGYKQTEVGLIPENWVVKKLGDIGKFKNGINKGKEDFGFGYPFVNLLDIFGRTKLSNNLSLGLVNSTQQERKDYELKQGDVLFVRSSVKPEGVGLTAVVIEDLDDSVYSGFIIRFRDFNLLNLSYKEYCFYEEKFRKRLIDNSTVSANTNINQDALKNLALAFPPTVAEQKAIAQSLSDVDALITECDRLITKKRNNKQGTMEQLLTGKKRLPGFGKVQGYKQTEIGMIPDDWNVLDIADIVENNRVPSGIYKEKTLYGKGIKIIKLSDVFSLDYFDPAKAKRVVINGNELLSYRVRVGDIFIALASVKLEGVGKVMLVTELDEETAYDHNVALIRANEVIDAKFLFYMLKSNLVRREISKLSTQVGTTFLKSSTILKFKLPIPAVKVEQASIATVLSDMDTEIAGLEQKRDKYKAIKQGMMQELLTGKTRLIGSY
ncbi:MAG: restriction endonuclease subunit S [Nostoc sp.]|uniref:restriction endonuclease subunit S n=1 Tax=Nostoc sp. TaxID=1180 RepID=UPI002FF517DE